MEALQSALSDIRGLGAELVAICPQGPEFLKKMKEKHGIDFEILRDLGNEVADRFGIRYELPEYLQEVYLAFGTDLPRVNGGSSWSLPVPARYVIDGDGIVVSAELDADYRYRPEPSKTLRDLEQLNQED
ncbi:MAG: redoxin domain-containing protein [Aridibacter famidurans]|nr:redoxin domain-containing protein [Aridibacter famidurans]